MPQPFDQYLAVLKASYDYTPQSDEDEIPIKEDQILFLLERVDDDWWKVKIKGDSQDDDSPVGLVPAAYVEPADHISIVKALYDYTAAANGELSVVEDELLRVFGEEDEWLLVQSEKGAKAGYVPANYVEAISEEEAAAPMPAVPGPPSTSRPVSTYVDPADRVALAKVTADDIKTWSVSEIDKKGKKKKGTLGRLQILLLCPPLISLCLSTGTRPTMEDNGHQHSYHREIQTRPYRYRGPNPINLHFHAGSKDNAEAIVAKVESSKTIHGAGARTPSPTASGSPPPDESEASRSALRSASKKNGASVHFSPASPTIIPARDQSDEEEEEEQESHYTPPQPTTNGRAVPPPPAAPVEEDGEWATALYDFTADGDDELSVKEGEKLFVLEKDGNDWWKCRNTKGVEGVVPASYIESEAGSDDAQREEKEAEARLEREAEEREAARIAQEKEREKEKARKAKLEEEERERAKEEREKAEQERKKADAQRRAKEAADAADRERKKRQEKEARTVSPPAASRSSRSDSKRVVSPPSTPTRASTDKIQFPPAEKTRVWHDRTGQFRVEAAFLGFSNGKLRLHKINGVIVEVPAEKMSHDDLRYVEKMTKRSKSSGAPRVSDDDIPLAMQLPSSSSSNSRSSTSQKPQTSQAPKKPRIDWFDFFLSAGCDVDDCTRYAAAFDRDKIDDAILPDITESTMRSLGLREGDIIRVKKAIEKRDAQKAKTIGTPVDQLRSDEELARQLQAEENGGPVKPPPNLFTSNGALKATRRGRPQPSKSVPTAVDLNTISTVSDQITRTSSPQAISPAERPASNVQPPARTSSALASRPSGFDDDAWTNRPSSTKPLTPTPTTAPARAPSAPPAQPVAPPPAPAPPAPAPPPAPASAPVATPAPAPAPATTAAATSLPSLAKTTESDIFDQLSRLSELRKAQQPAVSPSPPALQSAPTGAPNAFLNASPLNPSPMGVSPFGSTPSPAPMNQPFLQPMMQPTPPPPGPRGPLAPVPANQSLLQPLVPTQTGFNSFIPTRPPTNPPPPSFLSQPPQQPSFLNAQPTSFINSQPTGFAGVQPPLLSQPTGMPMGGFGTMQTIPFQGNGFGQNGPGQVQPTPTGFNPGFGQLPMQSSPPPLPTSNPTNNTSPANIFAQMKSGTFAADSNSDPQSADRYNALRPNPIAIQPTGWGGFQGGYNGYHQ
ncbi:hypothetical protein ONZ45_g480 [Pleurotus djamor]|nr:hypothetical protein ONZ45_g480 [Pleurotus djamor]